MSYKLGSLPSPRASRSENADFMEVMCLLSEQGSYSAVEAAQALGIAAEEEDDRVAAELPFYDVLSVIEEREKATAGKYPFFSDGYSVQLNQDVPDQLKELYIFLLLATRNDMSRNRIIDGIDGGKLFEQLCVKVLKNYFGDKCNCFVFGTGDDEHRSFDDKLNHLISQLKEPKYAIRRPEGDTHHQVDDKLDLVAHIPFQDKRMGQFIAFAQCKTGDSWYDSIRLLSPQDFSENHFTPPLNFTPIRVYMVSESFSNDWESRSRGVVFFDRCRLMRFMPDTIDDEQLMGNIITWNHGVVQGL